MELNDERAQALCEQIEQQHFSYEDTIYFLIGLGLSDAEISEQLGLMGALQ